jgi:hypothetical protein
MNPKDVQGSAKPNISIVPPSPMWEVCVALTEGALKYGPWNWRKQKISETIYVDAAIRHCTQYLAGEDVDPESGLSHITKAIAGLIILRDAQIHGCSVDNRHEQSDLQLEFCTSKIAALKEKYPPNFGDLPGNDLDGLRDAPIDWEPLDIDFSDDDFDKALAKDLGTRPEWTQEMDVPFRTRDPRTPSWEKYLYPADHNPDGEPVHKDDLVEGDDRPAGTVEPETTKLDIGSIIAKIFADGLGRIDRDRLIQPAHLNRTEAGGGTLLLTADMLKVGHKVIMSDGSNGIIEDVDAEDQKLPVLVLYTDVCGHELSSWFCSGGYYDGDKHSEQLNIVEWIGE